MFGAACEPYTDICQDDDAGWNHPARKNSRNSFAVASGASSGDRKSTRLNSSHVEISYAVFCLKKKKKKKKKLQKSKKKKDSYSTLNKLSSRNFTSAHVLTRAVSKRVILLRLSSISICDIR